MATRRLIEASEQLDPAERALLNLWVNRGLSDQKIAGLLSSSSENVAGRRRALVQTLAGELGLPSDDTRRALDELAHSAAHPHSHSARTPVADASPKGQRELEPRPSGVRRRARRTLTTLLAASVLLAVVLVALLGGTSHPTHKSGEAPAPGAGTAAAAGARTASTPPARGAFASARASASQRSLGGALHTLPGGATGASGSLRLVGTGGRPRLDLSIAGLPRSGAHEHYEVWLYNSISDAVALRSFVGAGARLVLALPADHRRYAFVDVSRQPPGSDPNPSGVSVLRAPNPAAAIR